ncbi:MAG: 2-oxoglutarate dehydrogenase complex dihydrolipoyllysine-residue succinyltransferase [Planctomycetota bacterium]|nr:2-oxoglutarate dehydrogenase complex dihydrolipoyllysine-residue succinyltransferase [Planctomycetota bacterium]MDA1105839.1 2-oxoglutarate dehydrogenase complex dihydrolipoyllysine-residue succinyltransferase [Planctomycetota bacterium]
MIDVVIPSPGESITEVTLGAWKHTDGDWVEKDELLTEIESDKATLELLAPASGKLKIEVTAGAEAKVGARVARIDPDAARPLASVKPTPPDSASAEPKADTSTETRATPTARRMAQDKGVDLSAVRGSGPAGRVTKDDVERAATVAKSAPTGAPPRPPASPLPPTPPAAPGSRGIRREKMPKIRQRIAERLVEAQHNAAMLTTFNECDMTEVMRLRSANKDSFEKRHGVGLGFMGFFVRAAVSALVRFPRINAYIAGDEIEFHDFQDIAVAVGTDRGLVVPVLRNAGSMGLARIEEAIKDFAVRARDNRLSVDEMTGGTFTITNGGVFGSLMSTPILNPPQSAILGMHAIKRRAMEDPDHPGQVAIRPMMYLALSYDHRIVDGAEAVSFLVHIKNYIERPEQILLDL